MDAVKQDSNEKSAEYHRITPSIRVLTYGKQWADLLHQENYSGKRSPDFLLLPMHNASFCLSEQAFNEVAPKGTQKEMLQVLRTMTGQASVLVAKLGFYTSISSIVLVDTDYLDTAIGHEILRNAKVKNIPAYAIGVTTPSSLLAPAYIKGVQYPTNVEDMRDFILTAYHRQYREKEIVD